MQKKYINDTFPPLREYVTNSLRGRAYFTVRKILTGFIYVSLVNVIFTHFFYTPKIYDLNRTNRELVTKYKILQTKINASQNRLNEIKHRDHFVYRSLFGVDSIFIPQTYLPYPEAKYLELEGSPYTSLMTSTSKSLDMMAKSIYANSVSLDELQILAQNKENLSAAIPAIWPIDRTRLKSVDQYGMRLHPIYKSYIFHKGIDLGADKGVAVYATGDAVVTKSTQGQRGKGYGQELLLDHEYGYETRYGHLSRRYVERGDSVKRGQLIGEVGATGGTTGNHLHYEVIYKGNVVNPINYFDRNMTSDEYAKLMEEMNRVNHNFFETGIDDN